MLCNFFFCHYVFKKLPTAEASESVYMRERVKLKVYLWNRVEQCFPLLVIGYPFSYRDFPFIDKICSKSSAAELSYEGKG